MSDTVGTAASGMTWPDAIESILDGPAGDPERTAGSLLAAASAMVGTEWAALVRWSRDGPHVLISTGQAVPLHDERLPEGPTTVAGRPASALRLGSSTDLVVVRGVGQPDFAQDDLRGLRVLAAVGARATDRAHEALAALFDVATKLMASRDLEEVLLAVTNATAQVLHAEIAGLLLVDATGDRLEMRSVVGHRTIQTARLCVRRGQGLAGRVFATGVVHRVDDWTTDPSITKEFLSIASREGTQSALCAPMRVGVRTIGVICAWRRRRSIFTEGDARVVTALAGLAAVAVEKARVDQAERHAAAKLQDAHRQLEERYEEAERALRIHQELTQLAVEGAEIGRVVRSLAQLTRGAVVLVSEEGRLVTDDDGRGEELFELVHTWDDRRAGGPDQVSHLIEPSPAHQCWAIVVRIRSAGVQWGHLAVRLDAEPSSIDRVAAEQAAIVCALLVARQVAAAAATRRLETEFVWDLLDGRVKDEAEALVRARQFLHALPSRATVVLVRVTGWEQLDGSDAWTPEQLERARSRIGRALFERFGQVSRTRVVAHRADLFVVLAPQPRGDRVRGARRLGELAVSAVQAVKLHAAAGVGSEVDSVLEYPESFRQAHFALSATAPPHQPVMVFEELGVLQFLLTPSEREDLDRFVQRTLGVLLAYDERHKTHLVPTIEAYLACDCNLIRAAERLFVHPKTMRYRLQRMQNLTGLRFNRQEDRFNLQLALKILHLEHR
jgi:sugar diacid utilization regulator/GAF domain-containing protein